MPLPMPSLVLALVLFPAPLVKAAEFATLAVLVSATLDALELLELAGVSVAVVPLGEGAVGTELAVGLTTTEATELDLDADADPDPDEPVTQ